MGREGISGHSEEHQEHGPLKKPTGGVLRSAGYAGDSPLAQRVPLAAQSARDQLIIVNPKGPPTQGRERPAQDRERPQEHQERPVEHRERQGERGDERTERIAEASRAAHAATLLLTDVKALLAAQTEEIRHLRAAVERLPDQLDAAVRRGADQEPGGLLRVATATSAVQSEAAELAGARDADPGFWKKVMDKLKKVSMHVWNMIAHLGKVKEWALNGQIGGVLGMPEVGVTITFGM